jgi:hypothetical protein
MTAPLFDPDQRRAAARIAQHSPQWVVIWGTHTRLYWAFRAPRGASLHSRRSREELGGRFLGLMANLAPKG